MKDMNSATPTEVTPTTEDWGKWIVEPLGEVDIIDVYVFYDNPRLLSCRDSNDQVFLVENAEMGAQADLWLYAELSEARLEDVAEGRIEVRDAYLKPEGKLLLVTSPHDLAQPETMQELTVSELKEQWLPEPGFRL